MDLNTIPNSKVQPGGVTYAKRYLNSFFEGRYMNYQKHISKPDLARRSCSRLSPYIAYGNLSMRQVLQRTEEEKAKSEAENAKVSIRNSRRDGNSQLKEFLKEKEISQDEERQGEEEIQKLTDLYVGKVEVLLKAKDFVTSHAMFSGSSEPKADILAKGLSL